MWQALINVNSSLWGQSASLADLPFIEHSSIILALTGDLKIESGSWRDAFTMNGRLKVFTFLCSTDYVKSFLHNISSSQFLRADVSNSKYIVTLSLAVVSHCMLQSDTLINTMSLLFNWHVAHERSRAILQHKGLATGTWHILLPVRGAIRGWS